MLLESASPEEAIRDAAIWTGSNGHTQIRTKAENNTKEQRKHRKASHLGGYSGGQKLWQEHSGNPKAAMGGEAVSSHLSHPKTSGDSQDVTAN